MIVAILRSDLLEEVLSSVAEEQLEKEKREDISKCLLYVYKSDLSKPCLNDDYCIM